MLFNSLDYFVFLAGIYIAYWFCGHRLQNILLLAASYFFYACWDVRFVAVLGGATVFIYCCALNMRRQAMTKSERRTASLWALVICFASAFIPWADYPGVLTLQSLAASWNAVLSFQGGWWVLGTATALAAAGSIASAWLHNISLEQKKRLFLAAGITGSLAILCLFKYYNWFIDTFTSALSALGVETAGHYLNIVLLVGISFYTFKCISYCMDVYRGAIEPERSLVNFGLYVAFFPSLLAGPIDRAVHFLPQITSGRKLSWDRTVEGLHLIVYGLFKKIVIADGVVRTVSSVYESTGRVSWIDVVIATLLFTVQIYCDFSGYTDMARGSAKLFGLDLMVNFNAPYFSRNPREFWSRWHISLSTWLRDYLYIPLGGNRKGGIATYRNLMVTMALGGLWHGASWNFVVWGLYHGIIISGHRAALSLRSAVRSSRGFIKEAAAGGLCFCAVSYGWLLFRSPSLETAINLSSTLVTDFGNMDFAALQPKAAAFFGLPVFLAIEAVEYTRAGKNFCHVLPASAWTALYAAMLFCLCMGLSTESAQFIYFRF